MHPFDSRKYGRAWRVLTTRFGTGLQRCRIKPNRIPTRSELELVHSSGHLDRLRNSTYLARALELDVLARAPSFLLHRAVLHPMLRATYGTYLAARAALENASQLSVNMAGGYHHAKPDSGEGFCVYSDIGLAIRMLRAEGKLNPEGRIAYVDLDAHQGNGVAHVFEQDSSVYLFDMYNADIYPFADGLATRRIDCGVQLRSGIQDAEYLGVLRERLPGYLDSISTSQPVELAIFNAGTDVFDGDPLGAMSVSAAGILQRDLLVIEALKRREIPVVMLLSGGYTKVSYQLVANSIGELVQTYSNPF